MNGVHLLGGVSGCRCDPRVLSEGEVFGAACAASAPASGLTVSGYRHAPVANGGFAALIVLDRAQACVRTQPGSGSASIDIHADGAGADAAAREVLAMIAACLDPAEATEQVLERGQHLLVEPLNDASGFYIKSSATIGAWETRRQQFSIHETPLFGRVFRQNGNNATSEREEFICNENLIHPTLTAHTSPRRALVIGGGDGGALEEILKHPSIEHVTLLEHDAVVIDVARQHLRPVHRDAFDDPRVRIVIGDGIEFARDSGEKFDLIALDADDTAADPKGLPVESLQRLRQALLPGGALVLHVGAPTARPERVAEMAVRLNAVFRIVRPYTMFVPLYGVQWAMAVCSDKLDPKAFTADEIDRRIEQRRLSDLRYYNGETHEGVFALPNFIRDLVSPPRLKTPVRGRRLGVVQTAAK